MEEAMLTPDEIARRLKVTERTVYNWLKTGLLPGIKLGRLWRVRPADLESFLTPRAEGAVEPERPVPVRSPEEQAAYAARVFALAGKYADSLSSVDEFCQHKQEEIEWENRRWKDDAR
jgi:excisionase family DNA binding protein